MAVVLHEVLSLVSRTPLEFIANGYWIRLRQEEGWIDYRLTDPTFVRRKAASNETNRFQIEITKAGTVPEDVRKGLERLYLDSGWFRVRVVNHPSCGLDHNGTMTFPTWSITLTA